MRKPGKDEAVWGTRVPCEKCESELFCFADKVEEKAVSYSYYCKKCDIVGPWTALAIRKVGHLSAATYKRRTFK